MRILVPALCIGATLATLTVGSAAPYARHRAAVHHRVAPAYVRYAPGPYAPYGAVPNPYGYGYVPFVPAGDWGAAEVSRLTAQAQREPGVTSELDPSAKQTASGGPVGGIPGFSGGGR